VDVVEEPHDPAVLDREHERLVRRELAHPERDRPSACPFPFGEELVEDECVPLALGDVVAVVGERASAVAGQLDDRAPERRDARRPSMRASASRAWQTAARAPSGCSG
jgi:hypothetical protein